MKVKALLKVAKAGLIKHGPQIATGLGIGLALIAGVRAVQKTPEAVKNIEKKKEEEHKEKLTVKETVEVTWKCYLPSILIFLIACALIIGGQRISARRATAAATACSILETKLRSYEEAVRETVGDKKDEEIRTVMAQKEVAAKPPLNPNEVIRTGKGDALFYDTLSRTYFWSDPMHVDKVIQNLNFKLLDEMYVSMGEYWSELGLPQAGSDPGKLISWCVNDGKIDPAYSVIEVPSGPYEGYPCKVIDFYVGPRYDYTQRF